MKGISLVLCAALAVSLTLPCEAGLKVYYLRHAQTGSNAKKHWRGTPSSKWPWYVGNASVFSPEGRDQLSEVREVVEEHEYDYIAVSPIWRARQTILPYLRTHHRQAIIWPELIEFGRRDGDLSLIGTNGLPPPNPALFSNGEQAFVPGNERRWFEIKSDNNREPLLNQTGAEGAADLTALLQHVIAHIKERFRDGDKSILLVGHGTAGKYLLWMLTGEHWVVDRGLDNTGLWMAEQQPDGSFKLMMGDGEMLATMPNLEAFKHPNR